MWVSTRSRRASGKGGSIHRHSVVFVIALALSALVATGPASAAAKPKLGGGGKACERWGDREAERLRTKQARKGVACLINAERRAEGLHTLRRRGRLARAAQRHVRLMTASGCFAHQCPGEDSLEDRLFEVGYFASGLSLWDFREIVAFGRKEDGTPRAVVAAWMASPQHRANLLYPHVRDIGVGFAYGAPIASEGPGGVYTVTFGLRGR
ncbi:MAG: CAP domain-containing protein [Solirubrobacterales bacterium]